VGTGLTASARGFRKFFRDQFENLLGGARSDDFLNFDSEDLDGTPMERFVDLIVDKLLLKGLTKSVGTAVRRGDYQEIPLRVVDGIIDWISYVYQLSYTFVLLLFAYLIIACY
jgi:hypothetical protein